MFESEIIPGSARVADQIVFRNLRGLIWTWITILGVAALWDKTPSPIVSFILVISVVDHLFAIESSPPAGGSHNENYNATECPTELQHSQPDRPLTPIEISPGDYDDVVSEGAVWTTEGSRHEMLEDLPIEPYVSSIKGTGTISPEHDGETEQGGDETVNHGDGKTLADLPVESHVSSLLSTLSPMHLSPARTSSPPIDPDACSTSSIYNPTRQHDSSPTQTYVSPSSHLPPSTERRVSIDENVEHIDDTEYDEETEQRVDDTVNHGAEETDLPIEQHVLSQKEPTVVCLSPTEMSPPVTGSISSPRTPQRRLDYSPTNTYITPPSHFPPDTMHRPTVEENVENIDHEHYDEGTEGGNDKPVKQCDDQSPCEEDIKDRVGNEKLGQGGDESYEKEELSIGGAGEIQESVHGGDEDEVDSQYYEATRPAPEQSDSGSVSTNMPSTIRGPELRTVRQLRIRPDINYKV